MANYKGKSVLNELIKHIDNQGSTYIVRLKCLEKRALFLRLMEGYTHLLFLTPLQPALGQYYVYCTNDSAADVCQVLHNLPMELSFELVK